MKVLVETKEVAEEGFAALLGQNVEVWCGVYIYAGKLVGVNTNCIKLANPHVVYETGALTAKTFGDAQKIGAEHRYLMLSAIESFGPTTKLG